MLGNPLCYMWNLIFFEVVVIPVCWCYGYLVTWFRFIVFVCAGFCFGCVVILGRKCVVGLGLIVWFFRGVAEWWGLCWWCFVNRSRFACAACGCVGCCVLTVLLRGYFGA